MNATHTLQSVASPTLRAIMDDTAPTRLRIRQMAAKLECALVAGEYEQLSADQRFSLRCLVFALHDMADKMLEIPEPPPMRARRRWWWGKQSRRFATLCSATSRIATQLNATIRSCLSAHGALNSTPHYAPLRHSTHRKEPHMNTSIATVKIIGITPLSQSRQHDEPKLEGERPDDYDKRTWREKLNVAEREGKQTVVIPAHGLHQAIASAAKYSKRQIPGQGKATWTAKFTAGITLLEDPALNIDPATVGAVTISANADGIRGSGKRVPRKFPVMSEWSATFDVIVLDPIITKDVFSEMLTMAGMFIGIGRFRPEKGGTNGRFKIASIEWTDNRQLAA